MENYSAYFPKLINIAVQLMSVLNFPAKKLHGHKWYIKNVQPCQSIYSNLEKKGHVCMYLNSLI